MARTEKDWLNFVANYLAGKWPGGMDESEQAGEHRKMIAHRDYGIARSQFKTGASDRVVSAILDGAWLGAA